MKELIGQERDKELLKLLVDVVSKVPDEANMETAIKHVLAVLQRSLNKLEFRILPPRGKWEIGDQVRWVRSIDWGPNKGEKGVISSFNEAYHDNRPAAHEYQVFYVIPDNSPSSIFWTTPDDVEFIGETEQLKQAV